MQVEHKTEKGTLCFLKIEDDAFDIKLTESKLYEYDFVNFKTPHRWDNFKKRNWRWGTNFEVGKWQLIGLTSEVREEQAKMMVDYHVFAYRDYRHIALFGFKTAIESFTSLITKLNIISVNKYGEKPESIDKIDPFYLDDLSQWQEAEKSIEKWIVLFKPNEK